MSKYYTIHSKDGLVSYSSTDKEKVTKLLEKEIFKGGKITEGVEDEDEEQEEHLNEK